MAEGVIACGIGLGNETPIKCEVYHPVLTDGIAMNHYTFGLDLGLLLLLLECLI